MREGELSMVIIETPLLHVSLIHSHTKPRGGGRRRREQVIEKLVMEETLPSILASVYGYFTPAVAFVIVNLVIGSIAVASKSSSSSSAISSHHPGRFLSRSPSTVLDRLRSFNLRRERSGQAPPPLEVSEILDGAPLPAERRQSQQFSRSRSDVQPTAGEMPPKLAVRLKKSASEKSTFPHFEEAEVQEAVDSVAEEGGRGGNEVDARADDFINRFRHQLKLQQMESIVRYQETLNRAS